MYNSNLAQSLNNPYMGIQLFSIPNLEPQSYTQPLANLMADQILSLKTSKGGAKFVLDQWLVSQGLTLEGVETLHKRASSKLKSNLLLEWADTYTTSSLGFITGGLGFFGGFGGGGALVGAMTPYIGFLALPAFFTLPFAGAILGGLIGIILGSQTHKSLDYVPTVSQVYSQLIIEALCQKQLGS